MKTIHKHSIDSLHSGDFRDVQMPVPTDTEMLDWIEAKQVSGEYIYNAIHWDGRKIRDFIAAGMRGEP